MDAAGAIATYVLDGDRPLTATSNGNTTFYLYGLGGIGEQTTAWSYSLPDGTNTPRQLSDLSGDITLSARYTPWGDTLDSFGTGNFSYGYLGGILDSATGLLYVGNGQYYDPSTGRFLTRDVYPNSPNPYVPWNPIGTILGPLAVLSMFYGRKKQKSKWDTIIILTLLSISMGIGVVACAPAPPVTPVPNQQPTQAPGNNIPPTNPSPNETPQPGPGTDTGNTSTGTPAPITTPSYFCGGGATAVPGNKTAYLTFDDGGFTDRIARSLFIQGMPSTFFVNDVGLAAANGIRSNGHAIGLHGWFHPNPDTQAYPEARWYDVNFNVTTNITNLKKDLRVSDPVMLRAPEGGFVAKDIFDNSIQWQPYRNAYFYGWDIKPPQSGSGGDELAGLDDLLVNGPEHAIILLHSNNQNTLAAVESGTLRSMLDRNGYKYFSVLPGCYPGNHTGYPPIGDDSGWVLPNATYPNFEEDGKTLINPGCPKC